MAATTIFHWATTIDVVATTIFDWATTIDVVTTTIFDWATTIFRWATTIDVVTLAIFPWTTLPPANLASPGRRRTRSRGVPFPCEWPSPPT